ncbi:MAG TPA: histidine kinase N-terminal 7TM domain-containing protein, partial [Flavisolibacter sp.]|nr:histidine kinase N-terminal 7TM domain-containing protein [Flavisolibacter sp.]
MITENIIYPLLSFLPALLNIGIVVYIFVFLPKSKTTDVFTLFVIALVLWQSEDTIVRVCDTAETARFWDRLLAAGWIGFAPFAFHFACRYTSFKRAERRSFLLAIYLPFIFFYVLYTAQEPPTFAYNKMWGWRTVPKAGELDGIIRCYIAIVILATVSMLFRHALHMKKDGEEKLQATLIATGILVPAVQGVFTQVVLPFLLHEDEIPLTSSFLTFFSLATFISLTKHKSFNIEESVGVEKVIANLRNIIVVVSPKRKVLFINPYAKQTFGLEDGRIGSFPDKHMFSSATNFDAFIKDVFEAALTGKSVRNYSTALHTKDNSRIDILLSAEPIVNNHQIQGILLAGNDITEQLKTLQELKISNERYLLVSKATNDMVWDWDVIAGKVYRNKEGWRKILGEDLNDELGEEQDWHERVHPDDLWKGEQLKLKVRQSSIDEFFEMEYRVIKKKGVAYVQDRGYGVKDQNGKLVRLIGATQDITQRKMAETLLQEEQLQKHKEITDAVIAAQEKERQAIGVELHDNVNQILTSAVLYLNLARTAEHNKEHYLAKTDQIIANAMYEVRKLSHALIPPSLSGETLKEALENLIDAFEMSRLFSVHRQLKHFDEENIHPKLKLSIYRIVQEQLN